MQPATALFNMLRLTIRNTLVYIVLYYKVLSGQYTAVHTLEYLETNVSLSSQVEVTILTVHMDPMH